MGRPVRVVSVSLPNGHSLDEVAGIVEAEARRGSDVIALPETWLGQTDHIPETLAGPTVAAMASLARDHSTYIVCPIDRLDRQERKNSAVLLDRRGRIVGVYDKVYPYWSEFDVSPVVKVGTSVPVFQTDFGTLGIAICFDVNFPGVWARLGTGGAELVIWPSAYSAGTSLQAHALNHHYYIVTATQTSDCLVYDITGEEMLYEAGTDINVSRITLDLDRGIYHENFNIEKRDRLLADHGNEVEMEKWLAREQWFVLRSLSPAVSARSLAHEYGLEELRDYIARSRHEIDVRRGARLDGPG
jgi:predicted amidohydrolase